MRRSCAPSLKQFRPPVSTTSKSSYYNQSVSITLSGENLRENNKFDNFNSNFCTYSVVWSRINNKKHKTWEGDGILEYRKSTATLKDLKGAILSEESGIKYHELYEGSRLIIGTKEIEIQEQINSSSTTQNHSQIEEDKNEDMKLEVKKIKLTHKSPLTPIASTSKSKSLLISTRLPQIKCEPLIFPSPSLNHQMKFNLKNRPVVEVKVSNLLVQNLRPHQRDGVIFLYECLLGYKNENYFGAIVADEMGLGKTLQCLTICNTLLKQGPYGKPILQRILIATPSSLTETWEREIRKWLQCERIFAYVVNSARNKIKDYKGQINTPFVIASYEMILNNFDDFNGIEFDLLICDEGHRLKNQNIKISVKLRELNIQKRIILSGTPIQNDLQEFFMLIDFVNPGILGTYNEYKQNYETPIIQGQSVDATEELKQIGQEKAEELNRIISQFMIRRTQDINQQYLPRKREIIIIVQPSELQQYILGKALEWYESRHDEIEKKTSPFQILSVLKKICNHPSLLRSSNKESPLLNYLVKLLPNWNEMGPFDSSKLELVQYFLQNVIAKSQEKVVLVSNHTKTLDILMGLCDYLEINYLRIDGTTQAQDRNLFVDRFNRENCDYKVFLLSSKAGGVGLNLSGASNLILFDSDWNPAIDLQAMSRIWRDGQKNDVKIYRLITAGTIEEKIFQRQVMKTSLSDCIINIKNTGKEDDFTKFSDKELKDLFSIQEDFNGCITHDLLECDCIGDGCSSYQDKTTKTEDTKNINELKSWEHYKAPINAEFLAEIGLTSAEENILFIFSCQNEFQKDNN